jgi:zinc protease
VVADDVVPLVTLRAFVRAGRIDDGRPGAAEALAHAFRYLGPRDSAPAAFIASLDRMAADYAVDLHDEWMELSLSVPSEDFPEALDLLARTLLAPHISKGAIEGAAAATAASLRGRHAEKGLYTGSRDVAVELFREHLYADHPYGRRATPRNFEALRVSDVESFHLARLIPNNVTLALSGALGDSSPRAMLQPRFGGWKRGPSPSRRARLDPVRDRPSEVHHYRTKSRQTFLVIGHTLPRVPAAEQAALDVLNQILAGAQDEGLDGWGAPNRLVVATRVRSGLADHATGFLEPHWFGSGSYSFRAQSRPEALRSLYETMRAELDRIRAAPVSEAELSATP